MISAREAVRQLFVVQAEQVQDRGLQIVDADGSFDHVVGKFVGLAVHEATACSAPGQPDAEATRMMIPTIIVAI